MIGHGVWTRNSPVRLRRCFGEGQRCTRTRRPWARMVSGWARLGTSRIVAGSRGVNDKSLFPYNAPAQGVEDGGRSSAGSDTPGEDAYGFTKRGEAGRCTTQGALPAAVGAGGHQGHAGLLASLACVRMRGHADCDRPVPPCQPVRTTATDGQQQGRGAGPIGVEIESGRQWGKIGSELCEIAGDQDEPFGLGAALDAQDLPNGPTVHRVAAQTETGLGGVGHDAAGVQVAIKRQIARHGDRGATLI